MQQCKLQRQSNAGTHINIASSKYPSLVTFQQAIPPSVAPSTPIKCYIPELSPNAYPINGVVIYLNTFDISMALQHPANDIMPIGSDLVRQGCKEHHFMIFFNDLQYSPQSQLFHQNYKKDKLSAKAELFFSHYYHYSCIVLNIHGTFPNK